MSILSGLFGAKKTNAAATPAATGIPIQTSCYGKAIAILVGTTRIGNNIIDYANYNAIAINSPASSGGGKGGITGGGGKGGGGSVTYDYRADLAMALCEGPIDGIGNMWSSQTETTPAAQGLSVFTGTYPQGVWRQYPYTGIAYAAEFQYDLGNNAQLPNNNFEAKNVSRFASPNGLDVDPAGVVSYLLSDPYIGAGFPASQIGELTASTYTGAVPASPYQVQVPNYATFQQNLAVSIGGALATAVAANPASGQYAVNTATGTYTFAAADQGKALSIEYSYVAALSNYQAFCLANGLWVSAVYDQQTQASSLIDDLANFTYAATVTSAGVLSVVPKGTVAVTGNGYTYTPPSAPLFDLGPDNFLPNKNATGTSSAGTNDFPLIVSRGDPTAQVNDFKVQFMDRTNQYASGVAEFVDQANVDAFGKKPPSSQNGYLFSDPNAATVASRLLAEAAQVRNTYCFTLGPQWCFLDPMDIVTVSDPAQGIVKQWVRISEMTEEDDGSFSITATEYPAGTGAPASYAVNTGQGYIPNYNADPGNINTPLIFGMPVAIATGQGLALGCALSGASANWGGCAVYASTDGSSYQLVGIQKGRARMGVTSADFPAGADPDTVDTLNIDLSQSGGELLSGTQADADDLNTLCLVRGTNGDEYVSYETATLLSANKYALGTYLRRGQYQTAIVDHPSGSPFARIDSGIFQIPYTPDRIGKTLYLKFASINIWDGGEQSLSGLTAYTITCPTPPAPSNVTGFSAQQNGNVVAFAWNKVDDFALKGYDIGFAPQGTSDWSLFEMLTEAAAGSEMTNGEVKPGAWTFGIRARDIADQLSPAITTIDLTVTNENPVIYDVPENPAWTGTRNNFVLHYTGVLVPENLYTPSHYPDGTDNGYTDFDNFVNDPVTEADYTTDAIDTGLDDDLRVFDQYEMVLGPGESGNPTAQLEIDTWLTGGSDPATFTPWTIGYVEMRYLREKVVYNPVAGAVAYLASFTPEIDKAPQIENGDSVNVAPGGTTFTFPQPFHFPPAITVTPIGSTALYATAVNVTATQVTFHVWDSSGTDVGGLVNYTASGE